MAQSMARNVIDDFSNITTQLIKEVENYVAAGAPDDQTEGNIRRLRVSSAALNAALNSIQFMPRPPQMPSIPAGAADQRTGAAGEHGPS